MTTAPLWTLSRFTCEWCGDVFRADHESERACCSVDCQDRLDDYEATEPERRAAALAAVSDPELTMTDDFKARYFREVYETPIGS